MSKPSNPPEEKFRPDRESPHAPTPPQAPRPTSATSYVLVGTVFEGLLAVVAVVIGRWLLISPASTFQWNLHGLLLGLAATVPMLGLFFACLRAPWRPLRRVAELVEETIVPMFRGANLFELAALCLVAGIGEELLFRGLLQTWIAQSIGGETGIWVGLALASALFGLAHMLTKTYFLLATLIGLYLGGIWLATDNLLVPITAHAAYDFVALLYYCRFRK